MRRYPRQVFLVLADVSEMKNLLLLLMFPFSLFGASDFPGQSVDPDRLASNQKNRRKLAWSTLQRVNLAEQVEGGIRPLWHSWYDQTDLARAFEFLFARLSDEEKLDRANFSPSEIRDAMEFLDSQPRVHRVGPIAKLRGRAHSVRADLSSSTRFSPSFVRHYLENYRRVEECSRIYVAKYSVDFVPPDPKNFTLCFDEEFPVDAVMMKLVWLDEDMAVPSYRSDASSLKEMFESSWRPSSLVDADKLGEGMIHTIVDEGGERLRLAAMHVVTKETREWVWNTYWWSEDSHTDLGADRPASMGYLFPEFSHYKMCVSSSFQEGDKTGYQRFRYSAPSLADSLEVISEEMGDSSWCANPYLEGGFPRTNCIGCHQGAGDSFGSLDTKQSRKNFPADFAFSFSRFRNSIVRIIQDLSVD